MSSINFSIFKNIFIFMKHFILQLILYTIKQIKGVYIMDKIIIDYIVKNVNLISSIFGISFKQALFTYSGLIISIILYATNKSKKWSGNK